MSRPIVILAERRLGKLLFLFVAAFVVMLGRLAQIQFVEAAKYEEKVQSSRVFRVPLAARRGGIYDRQGRMLAESVERFQVTLFPNSFRENNRIDALQDLVAAYLPELLPSRFAARASGRALEVEAREARFRQVYELRTRAIPALMALPTSALQIERADLIENFRGLRYPEAELILPPSQLPRRLENAILLLADNEVCGSRRALQLRIHSSGTLAEAMFTSADRVIAGIEREYLELNRLAHDVTPEDPFAFWSKIFSQERRNIARMERRVADDLNDQICKVDLGSHRLDTVLSAAERRDLARELGLESRSRRDVAVHYLGLINRSKTTDLDSDEAETLSLLHEIVAGRQVEVEKGRSPLAQFEDYEVRAMAGLLELYDEDPARIKAAYGARVRNRDDFEDRKDEYLSPEKEWRRIIQHRDGVAYQLFDGCEFAVANRVWESFGLRELGLSVRASEGRRYWEDETGVASLLVGRCNRRGRPLGGLEASLFVGENKAESDREDDSDTGETDDSEGLDDLDRDEDHHSGPLKGRPGYLLRRRELDRSYTTLPEGLEPVPGADVWLSIDRDWQKAAEDLVAEMRLDLGAGGGSAAAVIDLRTGDILVLASAPRLRGVDYLDRFLNEGALRRQRSSLAAALRHGSITKEEYRSRDAELRIELESLALYDRASSAGTASQCPPGSVLKPIAAIGMILDGVFGPEEIVADPKKGPVNFIRAVLLSSNYYFWEGARRWGVTKLVDWYSRFGLGHGIPHLVSTSDAEARREAVLGDAPKNIVIGQGSMSLSALEVATMMMNLARRGDLMVPRIIRSIDGVDQPAQSRGQAPFDSQIAEHVFDAMEGVAAKSMNSEVAHRLRIAAKTGTAELGGRHKGLYNAWFAGFAPRDEPRYAFAVVAERCPVMGKSTASYAGRLLELIMAVER